MLEESSEPGQQNGAPSLGRAIVTGCAVGVVVSMVGMVVSMRLLDVEWASAIGLGLFIAFWGGIGFGAMIGGVVHADRLERLAAAERSHDRG
ncbi:MAG: hypothetical protein KF906_12345 [Actinobacteria bacterium]|nr:hypothetical protein [Actinomycetota bacterium]